MGLRENQKPSKWPLSILSPMGDGARGLTTTAGGFNAPGAAADGTGWRNVRPSPCAWLGSGTVGRVNVAPRLNLLRIPAPRSCLAPNGWTPGCWATRGAGGKAMLTLRPGLSGTGGSFESSSSFWVELLMAAGFLTNGIVAGGDLVGEDAKK